MAKEQLSQKQMKERLDTYSVDKRYRPMVREERSEKFASLGLAIKLLFIVMLSMILISALQGNLKVPSFTSMLEGLQNFDVIPSIPFIDFQLINLGDWSFSIFGSLISFNWLRDIFGFFLSTFNTTIFFANGLISVINFVIFFVRWIFI